MFSNKIKVFLLTSICLIFFFVTYLDVKSSEIKVIDGDTIHLKNEKIRFSGIDTLKLNKFVIRIMWLSNVEFKQNNYLLIR